MRGELLKIFWFIVFTVVMIGGVILISELFSPAPKLFL